MASAELYQGSKEESFTEKSAWYLTALGLTAIGIGLLGGSDSLAVLGLVMAVGGWALGSGGGRS